MVIRYLNCLTCSARVPRNLHTGALCLLVETRQGLVLVDTGLGEDDYVHKTGILRAFQVATVVPMNPQQSAIRQLSLLGYASQDVRHIVLTHMHFDHCGGLPDFPHATVHVHEREYKAFIGKRRYWSEFAYVRRHIAHDPNFQLYADVSRESWYDLPAIRLPFKPQMWLIPLFGHTRGHCGVAVQTDSGWHFHVGDAAPVDLDDSVPEWLTRLVLGPHADRLRAIGAAHPDVRMTAGHMRLDFFQEGA